VDPKSCRVVTVCRIVSIFVVPIIFVLSYIQTLLSFISKKSSNNICGQFLCACAAGPRSNSCLALNGDDAMRMIYIYFLKKDSLGFCWSFDDCVIGRLLATEGEAIRGQAIFAQPQRAKRS